MWILKHPNPQTLAQISEVAPGPTEGWEEITEEEFKTWEAEQRALGWFRR